MQFGDFILMRVNNPDNVPLQELNKTCLNFGQLCSLMDSMFSVLHSKRGEVTIDKVTVLKKRLRFIAH